MGVSRAPAARASTVAAAVAWQDLECGGYSADLPLWLELAAHARAQPGSGAMLEIGAGTGRVALALARAGHRVTALERDGTLLDALARRAADAVETVRADARTFALERRDFALCIAPMQTVQLFGGARGRLAFLRRARAHLRPGGLLALAIIAAFEPFDCAAGEPGPAAEVARRDGLIYISRATRVRVRARSTLLERERRILRAQGRAELARERDAVVLANLSAAELEREGRRAGLTPAPPRAVADTADYVGSTVVMLRA